MFDRRIIRIPWTDKKRTKNVLRETNSRRELVTHNRRKHMCMFWSFGKKGKFEYIYICM